MRGDESHIYNSLFFFLFLFFKKNFKTEIRANCNILFHNRLTNTHTHTHTIKTYKNLPLVS